MRAIAIWFPLIYAAEPVAAADDLKYFSISAPFEVGEIGVTPGGITVSSRDGRYFLLENPLSSPDFIALPTKDQSRLPGGALPDGVVTTGNKGGWKAWLTGPTKRYDHSVLGDGIEASGFRVQTGRGQYRDLELPPEHVFEDRMVRFLDLDQDGTPELVSIKSGFDGGARISAYTIDNDKVILKAESDPVGQSYRWLNIVSAADFDGDGQVEIAAVITPHLGAVLRLFRLAKNRLVPVAEVQGFSNHGIGMRSMGLSAVLDVNDDGIKDIVLPDAQRSTLRIVTFAGGIFRELYRFPMRGNITGNMVIHNGPSAVQILFPLNHDRIGVVRLPSP